MNLVKKNIVLVVVLAITLIVAGAMIYFVIKATNKMKDSSSAVAELRKKINELNEQSPAPLQKNLEMITNDHKMIAGKVKEIQPIFGTPYQKAISVFAKELDFSVEDLKKQWRRNYRSEIKKGGHRSLIFVKFLSKFDSAKLAKALEGFKNIVNQSPVESINETNINGTIMEALGLPRKMDEISCRQYIRDMQISVVDYMKAFKNEGEAQFTFKDATVEKLSFEKYEDAMPRPDEVPFIFKHWKMIEDLFIRLKSSKISYIELIKRNNLLKGTTVSKEYLVFSYTIEIKGSLNAIRAFMNSMMDAHRDHKIYIIRSLSLEANDEAASILAGREATPATRRRSRRRPATAALEEEPEKLEVNVPIIGVSNTITAKITFDYVIFIGNEIKGG